MYLDIPGKYKKKKKKHVYITHPRHWMTTSTALLNSNHSQRNDLKIKQLKVDHGDIWSK